jgi:hypothetical protein
MSAPVMRSTMLSSAPSPGLMSSSRCRSGSVGVTTDSRAPVAIASMPRAPTAAFPMTTDEGGVVVTSVLFVPCGL